MKSINNTFFYILEKGTDIQYLAGISMIYTPGYRELIRNSSSFCKEDVASDLSNIISSKDFLFQNLTGEEQETFILGVLFFFSQTDESERLLAYREDSAECNFHVFIGFNENRDIGVTVYQVHKGGVIPDDVALELASTMSHLWGESFSIPKGITIQ